MPIENAESRVEQLMNELKELKTKIVERRIELHNDLRRLKQIENFFETLEGLGVQSNTLMEVYRSSSMREQTCQLAEKFLDESKEPKTVHQLLSHIRSADPALGDIEPSTLSVYLSRDKGFLNRFKSVHLRGSHQGAKAWTLTKWNK